MELYACTRKLHLWDNADEATRCCDGWMRLIVPCRYGETWTAGGTAVRREEWYQPGYLWKTVLVREEDTAEIERLLLLRRDDVVCPIGLLRTLAGCPLV